MRAVNLLVCCYEEEYKLQVFGEKCTENFWN